jgi:hypothetical protein
VSADEFAAVKSRTKQEAIMKLKTIARIGLFLSLSFVVFAFAADRRGVDPTPLAYARSTSSAPCRHVGGTVMTDFGAIDSTTTMGTATGDLRGAVSGSILGAPQSGPGGTVIFHVQHHWVTESGDQIFFDPATATTMPLGSGLFAVLTYPLHANGGTGKFASVNGGELNTIGEVHCDNAYCSAGQTVFRYSGQVCFAGQD